MSQLVKVTPSMNAERSAAALGAAVPGMSGRKTSQGIELMDDEVEEFSCQYKATGRVTDGFLVRLTKKIKYYMSCQCICELNVPVQTWTVQVCVTNKRVILRERMSCQEPGTKKCCYYAACLCCCPTVVESGYEEQICIERKEIKDYEFNITHRNAETSCLCCSCFKRQEEAFSVKLYRTRTVAETRQGWQGWSIDSFTKTYWDCKKFGGMMPRAESAQLRQVLHAVVAQNAAAAAQVAVLQKEGKADPVQLNVNLA